MPSLSICSLLVILVKGPTGKEVEPTQGELQEHLGSAMMSLSSSCSYW